VRQDDDTGSIPAPALHPSHGCTANTAKLYITSPCLMFECHFICLKTLQYGVSACRDD